MKRLYLIIILMTVLVLNTIAQETIIVGEVYDANTGQGLENVNVYFQGTYVVNWTTPVGWS